MPNHFPHVGVISAYLPPPPGVPESTSGEGTDLVVVLAIVGLVVGGAVVIAWLLKPRVARRYAARETNGATEPTGTNGELASPLWHDAWSQPPPSPVATVAGEEVEADAWETEFATVADTDIDRGDVVPETEETSNDDSIAAEIPTELTNRETAAQPPFDDVAEITNTVRSLLDFANAGEIRRGFSLYSERALERFRADSGLSMEDFDAAFDAAPAVPPDLQAKLDAVTAIDRLPDGRISALVSYSNGQAAPRPERYIFVAQAQGDDRRWLIDDIETVEDAAA